MSCIQIHRKEMRASSSLPKIRCQDYLEAVEDRYRRSIKTDYEKATKCRLDRFWRDCAVTLSSTCNYVCQCLSHVAVCRLCARIVAPPLRFFDFCSPTHSLIFRLFVCLVDYWSCVLQIIYSNACLCWIILYDYTFELPAL